jgi:hypothetical protein
MRVATNGFVPVNTPVRPATGLSDGLADMLGQLMSEQMTNESRKWIEARRSARILIQIQLLVRWTPEGELPLTEETSTVAVNAHGALITLALRVRPGNKLILRNWGTAMEREFKVVHTRPRPGAKAEVGISMAVPDAKFWGVEFPPEDWKPYL